MCVHFNNKKLSIVHRHCHRTKQNGKKEAHDLFGYREF